MHKVTMLALIGLAAGLAGCDGNYQKAGEKADAEHGTREHLGSGPGETAGRSIDKAIAEAKTDVKQQADAMRSHADNVAEALDQRADQLKNQADTLRGNADREATEIKHQADAN